jgi:predicted Zn-dependent protease
VRRLTLAILLLAYATVFVRLPSFDATRTFDPLDRRGREVERAIEERRFADALPILRDLQAAHPDNATIAYWSAEVHRGLDDTGEEARALEQMLRLTAHADAVCPALPEAYARGGDRKRALDAYERCAATSPDDPERWVDLGVASAAAGLTVDAERAFERSRALDPSNPRLPAAGSSDAEPGEGPR